jgi:hypothetical protein
MAQIPGSTAAQAHAEQKAEEIYRNAKELFHAPALAPAPPPGASDPDLAIATDQGARQYHLIGQKPDDPKYAGIMQENADNLLAFGGLIHNYMTRRYPRVDTASIDFDTWLNVIRNLPDVTFGMPFERSYTNGMAGERVPGEFLSLIAKANITSGAPILTDFTGYLNSLGDIILRASNGQQSYKIATFTLLNYLVPDGIGGFFDYAAIVVRQIKFIDRFQQLKGACGSKASVEINATYNEVVGIVQTRRLRRGGPDYELFQQLIDKKATAAMKTAKNFFDGGNVKQSDLNPQV